MVKILLSLVILGLIILGYFGLRTYSNTYRPTPIEQSSLKTSETPLPSPDNSLVAANVFNDIVAMELPNSFVVKTSIEESDQQKKLLNIDITGDQFITDEQYASIGSKVCANISEEDKPNYTIQITSRERLESNTPNTTKTENIIKTGSCKKVPASS